MTVTAYYRGENPLKADKLNTDFGRCIDRAGDTMVGNFFLNVDPTQSMQAATKRYVDNTLAAAIIPTGVSSWNTRRGDVVLTLADVTGVGGAPINAPAFTGNGSIAGNWVIGTSGTGNALTFAPGATTATNAFLTLSGTGALVMPGFTNIGLGAGTNNILTVNGAAGSFRILQWATNSTVRWRLQENNAAESGSNAGSDLQLQCYTDAGTLLYTPIAVTRSNGQVAIVDGTGGTSTLGILRVQNSTYTMNFIPRASNGAWSTIVQSGDSTLYYAAGSTDTGVFTIAPWNANGYGIRMPATGALTAKWASAVFTIPTVTFTSTTVSGPTMPPGDSTTAFATTAFVTGAIGAIGQGVTSFNGRSGVVTLSSTDVTNALTFTPYNATNPAGYQTAAQVTSSLAPYAPLASPTFTGNPSLPTGTTAITQVLGTNNTTLATTAFVVNSVPVPAATIPLMDGAALIGTGTAYARVDHVHPSDTSRAPVNNPTFTGTVTIPAGASISGYAPLASPVFTGDPRAPTPSPGDNDTSIATTAFVQAALTGSVAGVTSFNTRTGAVTLNTTDIINAGGIPQLGPSSLGIAGVDLGTGTDHAPVLTGMVTPYNAASDYFKIQARRLTTPVSNNNVDSSFITVIGPTYSPTPAYQNGVLIGAGSIASGYKVWSFTADGSMYAPGTITSALSVVAQNLQSNVSTYVTDTLLINPKNTWEYRLYASGTNNDQYVVHRTNWYEIWNGQTGDRVWYNNISNAATAAMSLSGAAGNLWVRAGITSGNGRVVSQNSSNNPGFTCYDTAVGATIMFMGGGGTLYWGAADSGGGYVGPLFASLDRSGNFVAQGQITATSNLFAATALYVGTAAVGNTYIFYVSGGHRYHQYSSNWYWDWDGNTGNLGWTVGGTGGFWNLRATDWKAFNGLGATGGYGAYENYACDARIKREIEPATEGLDEILMLKPVTFRKLKHDGSLPEARELGFIAQDVRNVIPQAVMETHIDLPPGAREDGDDTPSLGLDTTPIVAACVNAIQQLHARIATLEGRA